jgi:hypothetical protein
MYVCVAECAHGVNKPPLYAVMRAPLKLRGVNVYYCEIIKTRSNNHFILISIYCTFQNSAAPGWPAGVAAAEKGEKIYTLEERIRTGSSPTRTHRNLFLRSVAAKP